VVPGSVFLALNRAALSENRAEGRSARRMPWKLMLGSTFFRNWYALSDPMAEEMLSTARRCAAFAGIELGETAFLMRPPNPQLPPPAGAARADARRFFAGVNAHLTEGASACARARMVDATIIDAPSSARNIKSKGA